MKSDTHIHKPEDNAIAHYASQSVAVAAPNCTTEAYGVIHCKEQLIVHIIVF